MFLNLRVDRLNVEAYGAASECHPLRQESQPQRIVDSLEEMIACKATTIPRSGSQSDGVIPRGNGRGRAWRSLKLSGGNRFVSNRIGKITRGVFATEKKIG